MLVSYRLIFQTLDSDTKLCWPNSHILLGELLKFSPQLLSSVHVSVTFKTLRSSPVSIHPELSSSQAWLVGKLAETAKQNMEFWPLNKQKLRFNPENRFGIGRRLKTIHNFSSTDSRIVCKRWSEIFRTLMERGRSGNLFQRLKLKNIDGKCLNIYFKTSSRFIQTAPGRKSPSTRPKENMAAIMAAIPLGVTVTMADSEPWRPLSCTPHPFAFRAQRTWAGKKALTKKTDGISPWSHHHHHHHHHNMILYNTKIRTCHKSLKNNNYHYLYITIFVLYIAICYDHNMIINIP